MAALIFSFIRSPNISSLLVVADQVSPMAAGPTGGTVTLNSGTDQLTGTFSLPANVERAYLDVFAQSQSNDEFWYTCAPNDVAGELEDCGNTGFREGEVSIDGKPAGIAPVYPWIYTGGIDPYLWRPVPDIQTLNFAPYRVDLTPFASTLSDGNQHTVAISVYNADQSLGDRDLAAISRSRFAEGNRRAAEGHARPAESDGEGKHPDQRHRLLRTFL